MPYPRTTMRKIREVLRLRLAEGLSPRQISTALGLPRITVRRHLDRAAERGVRWPLPGDMDDRALEEMLFARLDPTTSDTRPQPEWATVHRELRRKGVTLQLLWQEYQEQAPDGFQYTWFSTHYRAYQRRLDLVMRHDHLAGEKLFVDFPGQTVSIYDRTTQAEVMRAEIFVAVLGASNYTYAEALPSQQLPHWVKAHVNCFDFIGGCPLVLVPDNLKSAITKAHRYEPLVNDSYLDMATHFGAVVMPARPRKPRDKPRVERVVPYCRESGFAGENFADLAASRIGIPRWCLEDAGMRTHGTTQRRPLEHFRDVEQAHLLPVPTSRYEIPISTDAKVGRDHPISVAKALYSVPGNHIGERGDVRADRVLVKIFHRGRLLREHPRPAPGGGSTFRQDLPQEKTAYAMRDLEYLKRVAAGHGDQIGVYAARLVDSPLPWTRMRQVYKLLGLVKRWGPERGDRACGRCLELDVVDVNRVIRIVERALERERQEAGIELAPLVQLRFARQADEFSLKKKEVDPHACGKTMLATSLGHLATRRRHPAFFGRADQIFKRLKASRLDGTYEQELRRLLRVDLLILDDVCLQAMDAIETHDFYEIGVERYRRTSMVLTSNREPKEWLSVMADPMLAQSAVDRIANSAFELVLEGESYRPRQKPQRLQP